MLARKVAIFRDKYLEIGPWEGEWNREIDRIRGMVCREFPKRAVKQATDTLKSLFCIPESVFWRRKNRV
jgi:hypothetical protein